MHLKRSFRPIRKTPSCRGESLGGICVSQSTRLIRRRTSSRDRPIFVHRIVHRILENHGKPAIIAGRKHLFCRELRQRRRPHTVEVTGSNPVPPNRRKSRRILGLGYLPAVGSAAQKPRQGRYSTVFARGSGLHMPQNPRKLPSYRLHRVSGQAVVTILGIDHYLAKFGSSESWNGI